MRHFMMGLVGAWSLVCVGSGAWAWQVTINGTANRGEEAIAVAVDSAGDVVAAGWTDNRGSFNDFTVVKVEGASGAELWRVVIAGSGRGGDLAIAVAVDGAGDVVAAGWTDNDTSGTGLDFLVVKLAGSTGAELWRYVLNPADGDDEAYAVAVDSAGDVVAAGYTSNTGPWDFTVVKLAGSTGAELWRYILNPADDFDLAFAVTVDAAGDVVAAGATQTAGTSTDFTVVKLAGPSGAERWRAAIAGSGTGADAANAVTVDGVGDVVAAGWTDNSGTGGDFTVVKLAGPSGAERWRAAIDGTGTGDDQAWAVAVDGAGDVLAAGGTSPTSPRVLPRMEASFTVVKLRGTDGGDF